MIAAFDCALSPDELENLLFQPSGCSVETSVFYSDPHNEGGGRIGLFVANNPLNHTDPTGYFSFGDILKIVAIVVLTVVTAGAALVACGCFATFGAAMTAMFTVGGLSLGQAIIAGVAGGFASGFAGSLLNGGSLGDAFKAGVIGGIVGGVSAGLLHGIGATKGLNWFEKGLAHGLVQGGASEAEGGQFRHGFYAGFAVGASEEEINTLVKGDEVKGFVAATVVGGTSSAIGGGKFANGAVQGAFSYLFNQLSVPKKTISIVLKDVEIRQDKSTERNGGGAVFSFEVNRVGDRIEVTPVVTIDILDVLTQEQRDEVFQREAGDHGGDMQALVAGRLAADLHKMEVQIQNFKNPAAAVEKAMDAYRAYVQHESSVFWDISNFHKGDADLMTKSMYHNLPTSDVVDKYRIDKYSAKP